MLQESLGLLSTPLGLHIQKLSLAFVLLIVSFMVAKLVQIVVVYILEALNLETLSDRIKLTDTLKKSGISNSLISLLGEMVFWIILFACGVAIIYSLNFVRAIILFRLTLKYLTVNVVSAAFVLSLSVLFASLLSGLILFIGELTRLPGYRLIARINQYVVVIFGLVVGLDKLGVSPELYLQRPDIILGFFALAGAIAFGLGCKDIAASYLANFLRGDR